MDINLIVNLITSCFLALYYWLEAIFLFFFPPARKVVRGDTVLITGAGSGIGQRLSIQFAKLGCKVVGWDLSEEGLEATKKELENIGLAKNWYPFHCDITDRHRVYDLAKEVQSKVGDVAILINNAGIVTGKNFSQCSDGLMQKTMDVNTTAHFWTIKAFLPKMLKNNKGHIVTIASGAGLFGVPGLVDYCASKFGAVGLAEALHIELSFIKKSEIKSTVVCPYFIDTGMFDGVKSPIIPIIKADDATNQIVDGILREKVHLLMPRLVYILYGLRGLLPDKTMLTLAQAFGVLDGMDTFVGRKKDDSN